MQTSYKCICKYNYIYIYILILAWNSEILYKEANKSFFENSLLSTIKKIKKIQKMYIK